MSTIKIQPNAAGSGTFSLASPNSSTSRTLTLPDSSGTLLTSVLQSNIAASNSPTNGYALTAQSGNTGGLTWAAMASGAGTVEAWVNFNGQGTVAIRADGNVSSITDGGTGNYTTNFSNNLSSANYSLTGFASFNTANTPYGIMSMPSNYSITTSSVQTFTVNSTTVSAIDSPLACVQVID